MHTAHLTLVPTDASVKKDQYEFHTPCLFKKTGPNDNDQPILLISKQAIQPNCKMIDCIGMLRFTDDIDSVEFHAEITTPVLVTPDWGEKHPWSNKPGLVQPNNFITCMNDRLGGAESFRFNQTSNNKPVGNCSLASRDHLAILGGHMDAKPAWFKITFWGAAATTAQALQPGQAIQFLSGLLTFQHWVGNQGEDRLSVCISARTILKGASPSGIPSRDGEAPPIESDDANESAPAGPPVTAELPPEPIAAMDYSDIPMP